MGSYLGALDLWAASYSDSSPSPKSVAMQADVAKMRTAVAELNLLAKNATGALFEPCPPPHTPLTHTHSSGHSLFLVFIDYFLYSWVFGASSAGTGEQILAQL